MKEDKIHGDQFLFQAIFAAARFSYGDNLIILYKNMKKKPMSSRASI